jgi:small-conductance mechanosensitive channel
MVTLELPQQEEIRILTANDAQLGALVGARELDPKLHAVMNEVIGRRQALAEQRGALQRLEAERDDVAKDQARLRDNLAAVPKGTPLYNRLIDKLAAEETRLDALSQSIGGANGEIDKATAALTDYVNKLTL